MTSELKFNLPEDQDDFTLCIHGKDFYSVLWDLDQFLRESIKYNNKDELQPVRDKLYQLMEESNLSFTMVQ